MYVHNVVVGVTVSVVTRGSKLLQFTLRQNYYFPEPNQHVLTFLHPIFFTVQDPPVVSATRDLNVMEWSPLRACSNKLAWHLTRHIGFRQRA
jgi:hypothetical protein